MGYYGGYNHGTYGNYGFHYSKQGVQTAPKTSGQGRAVFEWEEELTSAMPADALEFEEDMHGGFNEDVNTGLVYTGIPGYGLCEIS